MDRLIAIRVEAENKIREPDPKKAFQVESL
jgi:hypothetical protein